MKCPFFALIPQTLVALCMVSEQPIEKEQLLASTICDKEKCAIWDPQRDCCGLRAK